MPTRWRGVARALDSVGTEYRVRRWRSTKAAAENATRDAGLERLAELARARAEAQTVEDANALGDWETTVAYRVDHYLTSPRFARLARKTRQDYGYAADRVKAHAIGGLLPRDADVALVRQFLVDMAVNHGSAGAKHSRAVLRSALDLANGVTALAGSSLYETVMTRGAVRFRRWDGAGVRGGTQQPSGPGIEPLSPHVCAGHP